MALLVEILCKHNQYPLRRSVAVVKPAGLREARRLDAGAGCCVCTPPPAKRRSVLPEQEGAVRVAEVLQDTVGKHFFAAW